MQIYLGEQADAYRTQYIDHFVNKNCDYYINNIQHLKLFSDGMCYAGYLWDCVANKTVWMLDEAMAFLRGKDDILYVLWDINSADRILIPNYWKFPKKAVVSFLSGEIDNILPLLPEDCYIFDETFCWTVILTHEYRTATDRIVYALMRT